MACAPGLAGPPAARGVGAAPSKPMETVYPGRHRTRKAHTETWPGTGVPPCEVTLSAVGPLEPRGNPVEVVGGASTDTPPSLELDGCRYVGSKLRAPRKPTPDVVEIPSRHAVGVPTVEVDPERDVEIRENLFGGPAADVREGGEPFLRRPCEATPSGPAHPPSNRLPTDPSRTGAPPTAHHTRP